MGRKLIAFDNSALQRLWDDPDQRRIIIEAAAVREILMRIEAHEHSFLLTWPLVKEVQMAPKADFTLRALGVLPDHVRYTPATVEVADKAYELHALGLPAFDALHVACAILGGADV
jgi:hypothetical protein